MEIVAILNVDDGQYKSGQFLADPIMRYLTGYFPRPADDNFQIVVTKDRMITEKRSENESWHR